MVLVGGAFILEGTRSAKETGTRCLLLPWQQPLCLSSPLCPELFHERALTVTMPSLDDATPLSAPCCATPLLAQAPPTTPKRRPTPDVPQEAEKLETGKDCWAVTEDVYGLQNQSV
ncbi:hypothetical protein ANANG_G00314260 [Anguilla anguilla]|uniref:Uncharacterized protein n=1 Tax=Anguilla anguilla TaxID=7936 RepID=A0A9D3LJV9_ANGAN|nr:hypothetical protein ANANG_G00314260 [Anguilla anguilla]